jgi:hypothetical protein
MMLFVLLPLLFLLTGCGGSAPPDTAAIVKALLASTALAAGRSKAGSAAMHYVERRVIYLVGKNSSWGTESGFPSLTSRIGSEMNQVAVFVDSRITTLTGTDPVTPAHRDLQDAAKHLTTDGPTAISSQFQKNVKERKERIAQIGWRACAIEPGVWNGGDSTLAPTLKTAPLIEVLDRRLHSVEMLILHDEGAMGKWSLTSATGGWKDQQRTSLFQYPWVRFPDHDPSDFRGAIAAAGLTLPGLAPDWLESPGEINYKLQARVRPAAFPEWIWDQANYVLSLAPGVPCATALEHMMPIASKTDAAFEDFYERNWVYCDIMLAALHMQGFRFSRLRKTGSDGDFNAAAAAGVTLRPLISVSGAPNISTLMTNAAPWFDAVAIPHDELQVGDHLIFWNNQFVRFILGSAFGLENSYVTRIGSDGHQVMLAGHGMLETNEKNFAEEMSDEMKRTFEKLRARINSAATPGPAPPVIGLKTPGNIRFQVVNWAPFGELFAADNPRVLLQAEGAWWIRLKLEQLRDFNAPVPSMTEALAMIPKAVRVERPRMTPPTLPAGDFQPDYQEAIYLPLSVPAGVNKGWETYLANPNPGGAVTLVDMIPDGTLVPGFFLKGAGQQSKIPVLRPKVQP